jgi:phage FluMu protein Com
LVTQSKNIDIGVGGETRIALVAENGSYFDERDYVSTVETRAADFLKLTDDLFLLCADLSISETQLSQQLDEYKARIVQQRREHLQATADWLFSTGFASAAPYSYLPSFVLTLMADGRTVFSEDAEKLNAMRALIEKFKSHPLFFKCPKCGAEVEYLVEETEGGTLISHDIAAKDIGTLKRRRPTLGSLECPDCKAVRRTPAKVTRYRKIGAAEWIEMQKDAKDTSAPSTSGT